MLIDTSGLLAYFDRSSNFHQKADKLFRSAKFRIIHSYVLTEFVPLCEVRGFFRPHFLDFVKELGSNSEIEVVWVSETLHKRAFSLLEERKDKKYSLCDAVSFVLMKERGLLEALTSDHHFEQEGLIKLL